MSRTRLKVLLVHSTLHIGGAEEVSANICRRIDRDEFDVHVCFLKERGVIADKIESEGTIVHAVADEHRKRTDYMTWWKLRRLISREKFKVIHSHDVHSLIDGSLCRLTTPSLRHIHTFHFGNYPNRAKEFRRLERAAWRVPDQLVTVSDHQQEGVRALYGIPQHRVQTLWNGVDVLPAIEPVPEIARFRKEGRTIIGSVNTLIEQKGMPDLIRVAQILKSLDAEPFVFLIAGGGPLLDELRSSVVDKGLQNEVVFLDWVKQAPQSVIPYIDIFFQPSHWEAMSIVLLESMAVGSAIVATSVGETPRILKDNVHGVVLPAGDTDAMASAIMRLVSNPELRKELGENARVHYQDHFTATSMAKRHESLYRSISHKNK